MTAEKFISQILIHLSSKNFKMVNRYDFYSRHISNKLKKTMEVFVYFLNCLFRFSIGFVVYISFLIFVSYLKYVVNSFQLLLHEFITAIYFFPHFSSSASSLFSTCSNVGALYISFRSDANSLTSL